ncbi:MAG TPA: hypothetical protein VK390_01185 [Propionibacteriaceae bacterium]|nr:hypothetical protein [Propionibacteriaceae bacterium]
MLRIRASGGRQWAHEFLTIGPGESVYRHTVVLSGPDSVLTSWPVDNHGSVDDPVQLQNSTGLGSATGSTGEQNRDYQCNWERLGRPPTSPRTRPHHCWRSLTHQSGRPAVDHVAISTWMGGRFDEFERLPTVIRE